MTYSLFRGIPSLMTTKSIPRLTAKQEAFIVNYVISPNHNATQAAIKAGYSPRTAAVSASENLNKPYVIARRKELEDKIAASKLLPELERREILARLARETHFQPVTAGDRIRSIDTLNKLDKLYSDTPPGYQDNRVLNIIVLNAETKNLIADIADWTRKPQVGAESQV